MIRYTFILYMFINQVLAIPISIVKNSDLNFGIIPAGDPTVIVPPGSSENPQNASFTITGDPNVAFSIVLPSTITILLNGTGPTQLQVNAVNSNPSGSSILDGAGLKNIFVGGSLNVPPGIISGNYTGSFTVEVAY